jgi:hypothetical protein
LELSFGDDGADDSAKARIEQLMRHKYQVRTETIIDSDLDAPLSCLTEDQYDITVQVVGTVPGKAGQVVFQQGSAGTGKAFTVSPLISALTWRGEKCLIAGRTGIAVLQCGAKLFDIWFSSSELPKP